MIQSMTGYSRTASHTPFGTVTVELRSTNHRFLEVAPRIPNGLAGLETEAAQMIRGQIKRGRLELAVAIQPKRGASKRVVFDEAAAADYLRRLKALQRRLHVKGDITLEQILALPHVVGVEEHGPEPEIPTGLVRQAIGRALRELVTMRRREGQRLLKDIRAHLAVIHRRAATIRKRLPKSIAEQRARLRDRLKEFVGGASGSPAQIQQALALIKEVDIHEELIRLESHEAQLQQLLASDGPIGKKLDFIAQELMREANTIGAKANDVQIARDVVEIKGAIEKIREQAQNLE